MRLLSGICYLCTHNDEPTKNMDKMNILSKLCLTATLCMAFALSSVAKITLPPVISSGMVLQQESCVALWGKTDNKQGKVTIKTLWNKKSYSVTADADGLWRVKVDTPAYGGPYDIELSDGERLILSDVLIGEVWLCSGQSNMDMRMRGRYNDPVNGFMDEVVTAPQQQIRMFTEEIKTTGEPLFSAGGGWAAATSESIPEFSATAYHFAKKLYEVLQVPVGIVHASCGGSRVEAWMSKEAVAPWKDNKDVQNAYCLYNGMLSPVLGYGVRGFLWYQGEANREYPDLYTELFPAMVQDWRTRWGNQELPFYFAQIAPFNYNKGVEKGQNSAFLREAQQICLSKIPHSGMIILSDMGYEHTIHPLDKEPVGKRFAYLALSKTYGMKGFPATGPIYSGMEVKDKEIILSFENVGTGLTSFRKPLTDFEIAGEDRVFRPARVRYDKECQHLIVSSQEVEKPVAVRYGFKDYFKGSLFNMAGLPAASFRTDDWDVPASK